jgi:hypothetical protein
MKYGLALQVIRKLVRTNLERVPVAEINAAVVTRSIAAFGSGARVTIEGEEVGSDLKCEQDSGGNERGSEAHCRNLETLVGPKSTGQWLLDFIAFPVINGDPSDYL